MTLSLCLIPASLHLVSRRRLSSNNDARTTFTSVTRKVQRLIIDKGKGEDERSKFPARGVPLKVRYFKRRTLVPFANSQLLSRRKGLTLSGGVDGSILLRANFKCTAVTCCNSYPNEVRRRVTTRAAIKLTFFFPLPPPPVRSLWIEWQTRL